MRSKCLKASILALLLAGWSVNYANAGSILRVFYDNIPGTTVASLTGATNAAAEPLARAASETLVKAAPAARPSMLCSCCGDFSHVRPVILSGNRMTSLFFCESTCWSDRLATLDMVPTCTTCGRYLQPNEYTADKCGVCK